MQIDYFLNKRMNYEIAFDKMCSFFLPNQDYKEMLFGYLTQS